MAPTPEAVAVCEALLFIAERPLTAAEVAEFAGLSRAEGAAALDALGSQLADSGRGLRLQQHDGHFQLVTAPEVGSQLATYAAREESRLSQAALEALAVVAYRQPVTRSEVERVRGVDSDYVLRSLLHRRLIQEVGRRDTPGRPILYGTTFGFLERFGITSLDDLPPISAEAAGLVASVADDGE